MSKVKNYDEIQSLIENFDLFGYLDSRGIEYHTSGKNVSRGWVEITCPFDCPDPSWHCGINLESKGFHCWVCGTKGNLIKLICQIEGCTRRQAVRILREFQAEVPSTPPSMQRFVVPEYPLPSEARDELLPIQREYLECRGFDPSLLQRKYGIKGTGIAGRYRYRIIIPVIMQGRIKGFVALSPLPSLQPKYLSSRNIKRLVYNLDSVRGDTAVIVEGVTDAWRIGDGAIAIFGKNITSEQLRLILARKLKRVIVMLDGDATREAYKLASKLSPFLQTEVWELPEHLDPDTLPPDALEEVRREVQK